MTNKKMDDISVEIERTMVGYRLTFLEDYNLKAPSAFSKDSAFAIAGTSLFSDEWTYFSPTKGDVRMDGLEKHIYLISQAHSLSVSFQKLLNLSRELGVDFEYPNQVISFKELEEFLRDRIGESV